MPAGSTPTGEEAVVVVPSSPSFSDGNGPSQSHCKRGSLRSRLCSASKTEKCEEGKEEEGGADDHGEEEEVKNVGEVVDRDSIGGENGSPSSSISSVIFPVKRVKTLLSELEDCRPSHESVFLINKAVELFLEKFVDDAHKKGNRSITYKNLSSAVCAKKKYQFLSDYVPEKIKAEDALKARASLES